MVWGWRLWWVLWAALAVPWRDVGAVPQWQRVEWLPFAHVRPRDWALNFLFFLLFGGLAAQRGWSVTSVMLVAAALSLSTELTQLFAPTRYPSITDVITNVAGAALGILLATRLLAQRRSYSS